MALKSWEWPFIVYDVLVTIHCKLIGLLTVSKSKCVGRIYEICRLGIGIIGLQKKLIHLFNITENVMREGKTTLVHFSTFCLRNLSLIALIIIVFGEIFYLILVNMITTKCIFVEKSKVIKFMSVNCNNFEIFRVV